jgi:hypothetical protein
MWKSESEITQLQNSQTNKGRLHRNGNKNSRNCLLNGLIFTRLDDCFLVLCYIDGPARGVPAEV